MTAGLFFMMPVYLQMTLGLDALQTGIRIFPLSISLILFSIFGTRLSLIWSPRRIIRVGQLLLVLASFLLLGAVDIELQSPAFGIGMFVAGAALGLLASQIGNVNMSSVGEDQSSEVGGLQGVFQNLGSSLGTALIGSVLIGALATSFARLVATSSTARKRRRWSSPRRRGRASTSCPRHPCPTSPPRPVSTRPRRRSSSASTPNSQIESLRVALVALIVIALGSLFFSRGIPGEVLGRSEEESAVEAGSEVKGDDS